MTILWDDAVEEEARLVQDIDRHQMRLGQIADELEPKYGDSTLARYAQTINTNVNTLQNYRSVYHAWHEDPQVKEFPRFSVAKALVSHPDRGKIVAEMPDITEREARAKTKEFKEQQAKYEHYSGLATHKLTLKIVTRLDSFLKTHSPLDEMLDIISIINALDMEYAEKIIYALYRANERLVEALQRMNIKMEAYKKSTETNTAEEPTEEVLAVFQAEAEDIQRRIDEGGGATAPQSVKPFRELTDDARTSLSTVEHGEEQNEED